MDVQEYRVILNEHGRRVANRVAFSTLDKGAERDLSAFYACYGNERDLPEDERSRSGNPANSFDPSGWFALYVNHPYEKSSIIYNLTDGQSAVWLDQLVKARNYWGDWVVRFIYKSLICGESIEVYDAIADDQGEFVTVEDGVTFCAWAEGWCGWAAWAASVTEGDIATLDQVFAWIRGEPQAPHRWPEPGSPEAEARLSGAARRSANRAISTFGAVGAQQGNKQ